LRLLKKYFSRGYLIVQVEGVNLEKFLNTLMLSGSYIWNVNRVNFTTVRFCISIDDFAKLRKVSKRFSCRLHIVDKMGYPFLVSRTKRRKMLVIGAILCIIILYTISSFIWKVEVRGNKTIDSKVILTEAYKLGLKPGIPKSFLDRNKVENGLLLKFNSLVWAGVEVKGVKAIIEVVEGVEPPKIVDKSFPCNIIASKDGIIEKINVLEGEALVKEGQTVRTGQLLVSGVLVRQNLGVRYVHAMAQVIARVWYEAYEESNIKLYEYSGNYISDYEFKVGKMVIPIIRKNVKFKYYDEIQKDLKKLNLGNGELPIEIIRKDYIEKIPVDRNSAIESAKKEIIDRLENQIKAKIPKNVQIVDKKINTYIDDDNKIRVYLVLETLEDIGVEEKISN